MIARTTTVLTLIGSATAFVPRASPLARSVRVNAESSGSMDSLNGWVPDESKFAYGLPGSLDPVPEFDPAGFAADCTLGEMKRYREAEVTHARVAMLAVLGFLVSESFHPFFGGEIDGPAIYALGEVRKVQPEFFELLAFTIGIIETSRAQLGWVPPNQRDGQNFLNDDYYPGDIKFDPLGLKPDTPEEFAEMATKELQQGRLAMLAVSGFVAQELVNGVPIIANLQ